MSRSQTPRYYKGVVLTQCPYYISEADTHIDCEGYNGNTLTSTYFKSEESKKRFQKEYCFDPNRYSDCSHCILIDAKYKLIEQGLMEDETELTSKPYTRQFIIPRGASDK